MHFLGGKKFKSQNQGVGKISKNLNFIYQWGADTLKFGYFEKEIAATPTEHIVVDIKSTETLTFKNLERTPYVCTEKVSFWDCCQLKNTIAPGIGMDFSSTTDLNPNALGLHEWV